MTLLLVFVTTAMATLMFHGVREYLIHKGYYKALSHQNSVSVEVVIDERNIELDDIKKTVIEQQVAEFKDKLGGLIEVKMNKKI